MTLTPLFTVGGGFKLDTQGKMARVKANSNIHCLSFCFKFEVWIFHGSIKIQMHLLLRLCKMQNPKLLLNCTEYKMESSICTAVWPARVLLITWADCDARMNEMTQGPGQGMIDTTHVIAEQPHGDTCHVARGILRSPATFYHEYIIFYSILTQWQLILYLYSSFKSRLLSAPSHTNDINITIYLADSAISIITNGDHADKY